MVTSILDCKAELLSAYIDFAYSKIPCEDFLLRLYIWIVVESVRRAFNIE